MGIVKHGLSSLPEYYIWKSMRQRCNNPNSNKFYLYGNRGIKVCERWNNFINFYEDMGNRPSDQYSIDRIDVNGDYEPNNCKWSTRSEQMNNRREYTQELKEKIVKNLGSRNKGKIYSTQQKDQISNTICINKWGVEKYNRIKNSIMNGESINSISRKNGTHYNSVLKLKNRLQINEEE